MVAVEKPTLLVVLFFLHACSSCSFGQQVIVPSSDIERGIKVFGSTNHFTQLARFQCAAVSNDEKSILCGAKKLQRFDIESGEFEPISEGKITLQSIAFDRDWKRMFALRAEQTYSWINQDGLLQQSGGKNGTSILEVYDAKSFDQIKRIEIEGGGRTKMQLSPSGKLVALQDSESIVVVDIASEEILTTVESNSQGYIGGAAFIANETCLIFQQQYQLAGVDIGTGEKLTKDDFGFIGQRAYRVSGDPSGKLFTCANSSKLTFYDTDRGKERSSLSLDDGGVPSKSGFSKDGKYYAFSRWDSKSNTFVVKIADTKEGKVLRSYDNTNATTFAFSKDENQLYIFNQVNGLERKLIEAEKGTDIAGRFRSGITQVISKSDCTDLLLRSSFGWTLFNPETGEIRTHIDTSYGGLGILVDDGKFIWPSYQGNKVQLMRTTVESSGKVATQKSLLGSNGNLPPSAVSLFKNFMGSGQSQNAYQNYAVQSIALASDEEKFVVLLGRSVYDLEQANDGVYRQKVRTGNLEVQLRDHDGALVEKLYSATMKELGLDAKRHLSTGRIAVSPTGDRISIEGRLMDMENQTELYAADSNNYGTMFSPDGKWCLFSLRSGIEIIDAETGEKVDTLNIRSGTFFEFSQNSKYFVAGGGGKKSEIKLFQCGNWKTPVFQRQGTQANRSSIGLGPDGKKIYIGLSDTRLEVWDWRKL